MDESIRRGTYLLCAVAVESRRIQLCRKTIASFSRANQRRIHFVKERTDRRRQLLSMMVRLPIAAGFFTAEGQQVLARQSCLQDAIVALANLPVSRLVLEMADGEFSRDRKTMTELRRKVPWLADASLEHMRAHEEPLLWLPDALAWAYGASADWRALLADLTNLQESAKPETKPSGEASGSLPRAVAVGIKSVPHSRRQIN